MSYLRRSSVAKANEGSHSCTSTHTFIEKWNESYLLVLFGVRALQSFRW